MTVPKSKPESAPTKAILDILDGRNRAFIFEPVDGMSLSVSPHSKFGSNVSVVRGSFEETSALANRVSDLVLNAAAKPPANVPFWKSAVAGLILAIGVTAYAAYATWPVSGIGIRDSITDVKTAPLSAKSVILDPKPSMPQVSEIPTVQPVEPLVKIAQAPSAEVASPAEQPVDTSLEAIRNLNIDQSVFDQLQTILRGIEQTGAASEEDLKKLPPEISAKLRELISRAPKSEIQEGAAIAGKIIRVPNSVMAEYRRPDGIASIPDANSWVSTGGMVRLPKPGGGTLKTMADFKNFGLDPS